MSLAPSTTLLVSAILADTDTTSEKEILTLIFARRYDHFEIPSTTRSAFLSKVSTIEFNLRLAP